jgi:hypothetical protein
MEALEFGEKFPWLRFFGTCSLIFPIHTVINRKKEVQYPKVLHSREGDSFLWVV